MQTTDTIMMVRPYEFRMNEETAVNNYFQEEEVKTDRLDDLALAEFDNFVKTLESAGIRVIVVQDSGKFDTPDSIFPNNVISFRKNHAILYPMFAENRQRERNLNYLGKLEQAGIHFDKLTDYTYFEDQKLYLEGTGSMVLDRVNRIAYCSLSDRADMQVLNIFCEDQNYSPMAFHATQDVEGKQLPIYHTNVMMCVGTNFCLICLDSVKSPEEKAMLVNKFQETNKDIIEISEAQMHRFAGNMLEVHNKEGEPFICMSSQAFESLEEEQVKALEKHGQLLHAPLFSIEKYGGGSARCMMAEVFYQ